MLPSNVPAAVCRLKVLAESDPGAFVRVLHLMQARNIVPRRAQAQRIGSEYIEIELEIDYADCSEDAVRVMVSKLNELSVVLVATQCA